ncbi:MAG: M23 family metallopeptidase [Gemmatimonadaceae bacterium]|nr:M23 family metallopeptidase [Gemmatimonadaceae bacterium]
MPGRRWTIVIVPSDNEGTRSFSVTDSGRKALLWGAGIAAGLIVAAGAYLFTPYTTPAARLAQLENVRLRAQLESIDARLVTLTDTISQLDARNEQMLALIGLGTDVTPASGDSASAAAATTTAFAAPSGSKMATMVPVSARRPFEGRLWFGSGVSEKIDDLTRRAVALTRSFDAVNDSLTQRFERIANTPSIMPTTGWLSSHFSLSRLHPILDISRPHEGIDVAAPMGAPIVAPAKGRVTSAEYVAGYGNTFEIDHGNGIVTRFAHCSRILVRVGQVVSRGQVIGLVGNTGLSVGPHLHYEVHVNGKAVDPLRYVLPEKIAE